MKQRLFRFFIRFQLVQWFVISVLPKIRFSTSYTAITGAQFNYFGENLMKGDLVFSSDRSKLSYYLVGGEWAHVGIYVGDGIIVEAVQPKVCETSVFTFCHHADEVAIGRIAYDSPSDLERVTAMFRGHVGMPYDSMFEKGGEAFYCTELIMSLLGGYIRLPAIRMGKKDPIEPDEIWKSLFVTRIRTMR